MINEEAHYVAYRAVGYVLDHGARSYDDNRGEGRTYDFAGLSLYALHSGGTWRRAERLTLAGEGWTVQWRRDSYGYGSYKTKVYGDMKAFENAMIALKMLDDWNDD